MGNALLLSQQGGREVLPLSIRMHPHTAPYECTFTLLPHAASPPQPRTLLLLPLLSRQAEHVRGGQGHAHAAAAQQVSALCLTLCCLFGAAVQHAARQRPSASYPFRCRMHIHIQNTAQPSPRALLPGALLLPHISLFSFPLSSSNACAPAPAACRHRYVYDGELEAQMCMVFDANKQKLAGGCWGWVLGTASPCLAAWPAGCSSLPCLRCGAPRVQSCNLQRGAVGAWSGSEEGCTRRAH